MASTAHDDKQKKKKRKENKEELTKDKTWKIIGVSDNKCLQRN